MSDFTKLLHPLLVIILSALGLMSGPKVNNLALKQSFPVSTFAQLTPAITLTPTATPTPTPGLPVPTLMPGERGVHVPILLWHYISENLNKTDIARNGLSTPPNVFETQLQALKSDGFTPITFDELAAGFAGAPLPPKPILLTFDDGYEDFYLNAYPLLTKYQMKGTEFIPTGLIGGGLFMTWGQIEEMSHSPYVTFESHSIHHYYMTQISAAATMEEMVESKRILQSHVGYTINWFCYPYGAFNDRVVLAAKQAGYIGGITTLPGAWQYQSRFFYIPRYRASTRTGESLLSLVR